MVEMETTVSSSLIDATRYRSLVMSMLFIARFTRFEILFLVSVLATRQKAPRQVDMLSATRVLNYLVETMDRGTRYTAPSMILRAHADASYNIHPDGKGHSGVILGLGSAPIFARSIKIKCVARSAAETETYAAEEASAVIFWMREFLLELGFSQEESPTVLFQDNTSTMRTLEKGPTFRKQGHMMRKYLYIQELIKQSKVHLEYIPSEFMMADMLTKLITKDKLLELWDALNE